MVNTNANYETIPFSKNKVLQIAGNLISNAIKFTTERGNVTVDLDLKAIDDTLALSIAVTDTGIGISDKTIATILEGGIKSSDGTDGEKGYGFGLTMIKHLIDGLNGNMEITSIEGQGTRFEVRLPQH